MNHHKISLLTLFLILGMGMISCKDATKEVSKVSYKENLSIYNVKSDSTSNTKDTIVYSEVAAYVEGKKQSTSYFNANGSLKGTEKYIYDSKNGNQISADYYDTSDSLLSYYKYIYDNKNIKASSMAFDGRSNEILRLEKYTYDTNHHLSVKDIFTAENKLSRKYVFVNDKEGNVNDMKVYDSFGNVIVSETYKFTKFDASNRWIEKWGFINDEPKTLHIRTFE